METQQNTNLQKVTFFIYGYTKNTNITQDTIVYSKKRTQITV